MSSTRIATCTREREDLAPYKGHSVPPCLRTALATVRLRWLLDHAVAIAAATLVLLVPVELFPASPDEAGVIFFQRHYETTGTLSWVSELNIQYNTTIFAPRLAESVRPNVYISNYPWFSMTLGITGKFSSTEIVARGFALLLCLAPAMAARRLGGGNVAWLAIPMVAALPGVYFFMGRAYTNVPAASLTVLALATLALGPRSSTRMRLACSVLLLGGAILLRDDAVLAVPIWAYLAWRGGLRLRSRSAMIAFLTLFGLLLVSIFLGKLVAAASLGDDLRAKLIEGFSGPSAYLHVLRTFILGAAPALALVPFAIAMCRRSGLRAWPVAAMGALGLSVLAYGGRTGTWHWAEGLPDASLNRYFLASLGLALAVVLAAVQRLSLAPPRLRAGIMAVLAVLAIATPGTAVGSFTRDDHQRLDATERQYEVVNGLDSQWVFISRNQDKYVMNPEVGVGIYRTQGDIDAEPDLGAFFKPVDLKEHLVPIISQMLADGKRILISVDAADLRESLEQDSFSVRRLGPTSPFLIVERP